MGKSLRFLKTCRSLWETALPRLRSPVLRTTCIGKPNEMSGTTTFRQGRPPHVHPGAACNWCRHSERLSVGMSASGRRWTFGEAEVPIAGNDHIRRRFQQVNGALH